jgi:YggT family protein
MQGALTFLTSSILDLYVICFVLRLVMAWVRADFRNPLAQFIVKITNPLVIPARRFIPAIGGIDLATLVVLLVVQSVATAIIVQLACVGGADVGAIVVFGLLRLAHLALRTCSLLMFVYVVMSWVASGGYNPAIALLSAIVEPLLAPFRRIIPTIGGLDLSPVFALLAIEFVNRLVPAGPGAAGLVCIPI